jgi:branched-chain amino acid transport system permease protein
MGLPYPISFLLTLVFALIMGTIIQFLIMKPVRKSSHLNQIVITLGLLLVVNGSAGMLFGNNPTSFPKPVGDKVFQLGPVFITSHEIFIISVTILLFAFFYVMLSRTKIGLAMRATAQDQVTSELMGINVGSVFSWTWATAAVLGSVAGMLAAPITYLDTNMMLEVLIMAFAGAVLGGFVSLPGAIMGTALIGILQNLIAGYLSIELKTVFIFLFIVLILYIKPTGLVGKNIAKKV